MSPDPPADPHQEATAQLERFGLSTYAAETFVALASLGSGTARDVSDVSAVPRTRVYDAVEELHEEGLVDVQEGAPKEFLPVSAETAGRSFEHEFTHRVDRFRTALTELEPAQRRAEQRGVWTVDGQEPITERTREFFADAESEIVYMTVEDLLTETLIEELAAAAERGVSIKLGGVSPAVQQRIQDDIPTATMFESLWVWSDTPAGRLMLVDGEQTLVSVLLDEVDAEAADSRAETAIWGQGETNSLVVVLEAIFAWRLGTDASS